MGVSGSLGGLLGVFLGVYLTAERVAVRGYKVLGQESGPDPRPPADSISRLLSPHICNGLTFAAIYLVNFRAVYISLPWGCRPSCKAKKCPS